MLKKANDGYWLDRHHLFWQARHWNKGYVKTLREYWYCKIYLPKKTLHVQIHQGMRGIPTPRGFSAKIVLEYLEHLNGYGAISESDDIEKRLSLLIALFDCLEPETTEALRKQLSIVRTHNNPPLDEGD